MADKPEKKVEIKQKREKTSSDRHTSSKAAQTARVGEKGFFERANEYNKILNIDSLARRYLVMNSFDGVLTILGILMGGFFSGLIESKIIIIACVGAGVAMGVSGIWGAYLTETAERRKELRELESSMITKLKYTKIGRASRFAPWIVALIDGAAPFITAIFVIMPFFFIHTILAYYVSFLLIFVVLFFLGLFLGRISKESLILSALKMMLAGLTCAAILYLVGLPPV
jgi:predicted membrane protein (TIGR00267 family)